LPSFIKRFRGFRVLQSLSVYITYESLWLAFSPFRPWFSLDHRDSYVCSRPNTSLRIYWASPLLHFDATVAPCSFTRRDLPMSHVDHDPFSITASPLLFALQHFRIKGSFFSHHLPMMRSIPFTLRIESLRT
jgi:hypothetical protein